MVNSGSFETDSDQNSKVDSIQSDTAADGLQSSSPVSADSASLCKNDSQTADGGKLAVAHAIEPTPTKTEFNITGPEKDSIDNVLNESDTVERDNGLKVDIMELDVDLGSSKASLFCSVPLDKVQSVLSTCITPNFKTEPPDVDMKESRSKQTTRKLFCLYCERTFVSENLRQKHVERCHSEKQNRRLSSRRLQNQFTTATCLYCDKLSPEHTLQQLFQHMSSVHSDKYFACVTCEDRFFNLSLLNDHNNTFHKLKASKSKWKAAQKKNDLKITLNTEDNNVNLIKNNLDTIETGEISVKLTRSMVRTLSTNKLKTDEHKSKSKKSNLKELKNKKISVKTSKIALKRSQRLQGKAEPQKKKTTKTLDKKALSKVEEVYALKPAEKAKSMPSSVNPYPEFDSFYRVKKITDHSIDNLKISSLTFDDVFDKVFFNRIKCNIQENLLNFIDGKLFKNEESENRISNFEKSSSTLQNLPSASTENYGCELSLNAVTPVASLLSSQIVEDPESQIEYGAKPSKKKTTTKQEEVRYKYVTRRKYQASILEHKENRDLSKLDMWTQLVIKDRQQKVVDNKKTAKEMLEYTTCQEYKQKMQRAELNRILDRRGPFEDLKEEVSKKAALDKLKKETGDKVSDESFAEVREVIDTILNRVFKTTEKEPSETMIITTKKSDTDAQKDERPEIPRYLNLRRSSSIPIEAEIDKSDKIALICASQETENFELPTNTIKSKDEVVELSGEWARSRLYICAACGFKVSNMKILLDHKNFYHQNTWAQHYEFVGNQSELYRHLSIPGLGKVGDVEEQVMCKVWKRSNARLCTKCGKTCNALGELHRHILECGGDWTWMLARKKCKYRPFGAKTRKRRRGLVKRTHAHKPEQLPEKKTYRTYKKTFDGPRPKPSDAETIQRMLENLPAKRATRKIISMKDGLSRPRQPKPNNVQTKMKCGKVIAKVTNSQTKTNSSNPNNQNKRSLRSLGKVLTSRILDSTNALLFRRKMKNFKNKPVTRQSAVKKPTESIENESKLIISLDRDEVKNLTTSQPTASEEEVGEKLAELGIIKKTRNKVKEILSKGKLNIKSYFPVKKKKVEAAPTENKPVTVENITNAKAPAQNNKGNKIKKLAKSMSFRKKKDSTIDEAAIITNDTLGPTPKLPENKRKLRNSFKKAKKLKMETEPKLPLESSEVPFLELEKPTIPISPPNEVLQFTSKETQVECTPEGNAQLIKEINEEPSIPEHIFDLKTNCEETLQAKEPKLLNDSDTPVHETKNESSCPLKPDENMSSIESTQNIDKQDNSLLSVEITHDINKSPLSSPRMKGKLRKPARGLNDCIAMLTKKAVEVTNVPVTESTVVEVPKLIEPNAKVEKRECILRIPTINSENETQALDLTVKKSSSVSDIKKDEPSSIDKIIEDVIENKFIFNNIKEKAILKIPKIAEKHWTSIDNVIQDVINNKCILDISEKGAFDSIQAVIESVVQDYEDLEKNNKLINLTNLLNSEDQLKNISETSNFTTALNNKDLAKNSQITEYNIAIIDDSQTIINISDVEVTIQENTVAKQISTKKAKGRKKKTIRKKATKSLEIIEVAIIDPKPPSYLETHLDNVLSTTEIPDTTDLSTNIDLCKDMLPLENEPQQLENKNLPRKTHVETPKLLTDSEDDEMSLFQLRSKLNTPVEDRGSSLDKIDTPIEVKCIEPEIESNKLTYCDKPIIEQNKMTDDPENCPDDKVNLSLDSDLLTIPVVTNVTPKRTGKKKKVTKRSLRKKGLVQTEKIEDFPLNNTLDSAENLKESNNPTIATKELFETETENTRVVVEDLIKNTAKPRDSLPISTIEEHIAEILTKKDIIRNMKIVITNTNTKMRRKRRRKGNKKKAKSEVSKSLPKTELILEKALPEPILESIDNDNSTQLNNNEVKSAITNIPEIPYISNIESPIIAIPNAITQITPIPDKKPLIRRRKKRLNGIKTDSKVPSTVSSEDLKNIEKTIEMVIQGVFYNNKNKKSTEIETVDVTTECNIGNTLEKSVRRNSERSAKTKALDNILDNYLSDGEDKQSKVETVSLERKNSINDKVEPIPDIILSAVSSNFLTTKPTEESLEDTTMSESNLCQKEIKPSIDLGEELNTVPEIDLLLLEDTSGIRRSQRSSKKLTSYNENELADALLIKVDDPPKPKRIKKRKAPSDVLELTTNVEKNEVILPEIKTTEPEIKKLTADEQFDLLKATIESKPFEITKDNSNTMFDNLDDLSNDFNNDKFDNAFENVLKKSMAVIQESLKCTRDAEAAKKDLYEFTESSSSADEGSKLQLIKPNKYHEPKIVEESEQIRRELSRNRTLNKKKSYLDNENSKTETCSFSESASGVTEISIDKNDKRPMKITIDNKLEVNEETNASFCEICKKTFKRCEFLVKHKFTLTHISKLSEIEAKEAEEARKKKQVDLEENDKEGTMSLDSRSKIDEESISSNSQTQDKSNPVPENDFSNIMLETSNEFRRYKSLGERKSFECDPNALVSDNTTNDPKNVYTSPLANTAGTILEKQISLLEDIIESHSAIKYMEQLPESPKNSFEDNTCSLRDSPMSLVSSKQDELSNISFSKDETITDFKTSHIEEISEDSTNIQKYDDLKVPRKVLNRDEELFIECCSMLKSSDLNFDNKKVEIPSLNNRNEADWVDNSAKETVQNESQTMVNMGGGDDDTNSNSYVSNWSLKKPSNPTFENDASFEFMEEDSNAEEDNFKLREIISKAIKAPFKCIMKNKIRKCSNSEEEFEEDVETPSEPDPANETTSTVKLDHRKLLTKGALKVFEGLKVSIPTEELNLQEVLNNSPPVKFFDIKDSPFEKTIKNTSSGRGSRKSKPVKNKSQNNSKFGFKKNKSIFNSSQEKFSDIYDFEETQDNTDAFTKATPIASENDSSKNEECNISNELTSNKQCEKSITKKKCMIMGRIFKNAAKPKHDEAVSHINDSELVENNALICPKTAVDQKKPRMTEEEMNELFDKLRGNPPIDETVSEVKRKSSDIKNHLTKKKLKCKTRKRTHSDSESTDDEFGLHKTKKRIYRKKVDNSINLEQELKECIGVASRKSQRKCTSGKQNILVEYWSSDESAFEAMLESHLNSTTETNKQLTKELPKSVPLVNESKCLTKSIPDHLETPVINDVPKNPPPIKKPMSPKPETKRKKPISDSAQSNRRKRAASNPLYHWSSSSEDESHGLIEVKPIRDADDDEDRPVQHGWIVGDSPKKLVTMLALTKGKKTDIDHVKELTKKKSANV